MAKSDNDAPDDYEAVRVLVSTLEKFSTADQQRIIRWAREKLGLAEDPVAHRPVPESSGSHGERGVEGASPPHAPGAASDIKSFIVKKNPASDTQFAAAVAYFYRFEAPSSTRKEFITPTDIQDACRQVDRTRFPKPAQTLVNAYNQGLLNKGGERGTYTLSTVGENLVAVTLPASGDRPASGSRRKKAKPRLKKNSGRRK